MGCGRCGKCCQEMVNKDFWRSQKRLDQTPFFSRGMPMEMTPIYTDKEIKDLEKQADYNGKGCEMLTIKDGIATCQIHKSLGYDKKIDDCKTYLCKSDA